MNDLFRVIGVILMWSIILYGCGAFDSDEEQIQEIVHVSGVVLVVDTNILESCVDEGGMEQHVRTIVDIEGYEVTYCGELGVTGSRVGVEVSAGHISQRGKFYQWMQKIFK